MTHTEEKKSELEKGGLDGPPSKDYEPHDAHQCEEELKQWIHQQLEKILKQV
jgi:hypothetical protein